jgi:hypothetical protein
MEKERKLRTDSMPTSCPKKMTCIEFVTEDVYTEMCCSEDWIACELAEDVARRLGLKKMPREWSKEYDDEEEE